MFLQTKPGSSAWNAPSLVLCCVVDHQIAPDHSTGVLASLKVAASAAVDCRAKSRLALPVRRTYGSRAVAGDRGRGRGRGTAVPPDGAAGLVATRCASEPQNGIATSRPRGPQPAPDSPGTQPPTSSDQPPRPGGHPGVSEDTRIRARFDQSAQADHNAGDKNHPDVSGGCLSGKLSPPPSPGPSVRNVFRSPPGPGAAADAPSAQAAGVSTRQPARLAGASGARGLARASTAPPSGALLQPACARPSRRVQAIPVKRTKLLFELKVSQWHSSTA